jgi:3-keto-disaccharide hydrolase
VPHDHFQNRRCNRYRIVAKGPRIRTWISERPIEDLIDEEGYRTHPKGFIGLQVHAIEPGTGPYEVAWRGLRLRELSPAD